MYLRNARVSSALDRDSRSHCATHMLRQKTIGSKRRMIGWRRDILTIAPADILLESMSACDLSSSFPVSLRRRLARLWRI